jgi:hypothetical protein
MEKSIDWGKKVEIENKFEQTAEELEEKWLI